MVRFYEVKGGSRCGFAVGARCERPPWKGRGWGGGKVRRESVVVEVEDIHVRLGEGVKDRRVAERCVLFPFWKCMVDEAVGEACATSFPGRDVWAGIHTMRVCGSSGR